MGRQGGIILILIFLSLGFFVGQKVLAAGEVVINEICWMGSVANANAEWIELKNESSAPVDISGWTLNAADGAPKINLSGVIPAGGYFLLERTSDDSAPNAPADRIYAGALGNSGEILELRDAAGNLIDKVDASGGWPGGDNIGKQTMERLSGGGWQTSAQAGGTPGGANGEQASTAAVAENDQADLSAENYGGGIDNSSAVYGDVVINEFSSSPEEGEEEWIELYNHGGGELSLDNWTIKDGSGAVTILESGFGEDDYYFFLVRKPKGALNNSGDEIFLYNEKNNLIDRVVYGKYGDAPDQSAPAPAKGQSSALKEDGRKSLYDKDSFVLTDTPTPGKPNVVSAPEEAETPASEMPGAKILITEILPNPPGSDRANEFIELYNSSDSEIDLSGWRLEIEGGRSFTFGEFLNLTKILPPQNYFALFRSESNLILDNNGGTVKLFAPGKSKAEQTVKYGAAPEGLSFCDTIRINLANPNDSTKKFLANSSAVGKWVWNEAYTPGAPNQIKTPNHAPEANFSAPAEIITGAPADFDASDSFDEDGDEISYQWDFGDGVQLNLENPEHVFLRPGNFEVKLTISDGREETILKKILKVGGGLLSGDNQEGAANNFPLVLPAAGPVVESHAGSKTSSQPPPSQGGGNYAGNSAEPKKSSAEVAGVKISSPAVAKAAAGKPPAAAAPDFSLAGYKLGSALKISGTVIVLPGAFGVQYFYLLPDTGAAAVKIYSYKKDFPELALGDFVEAQGTVGGSATDKYLNTKVAANLKITGSVPASEPEEMDSTGFAEENLNHLVRIAGEVTGKSGSLVSLEDEEGKFNIYIKEGAKIDIKEIKAGQKMAVTGLLSEVSGNLAILPRGRFDIASVLNEENAAEEISAVSTTSPDWTLPERGNSPRPIHYFILVAAALLIFSAVVFWKRKK